MNATRSAVITGLIAGAGALLITSLGRTSSARKRTALGRGATDDANFMDLNSAPAEELKGSDSMTLPSAELSRTGHIEISWNWSRGW